MEYSKLIIDFKDYLDSLESGFMTKEWTFVNKTDDAFSTRGGSWKGNDGFKFRITRNDEEYILRSVVDEWYIVLESYSKGRQVYNMDLSKSAIHQNSLGESILFESFIMTAGKGRVKMKTVQDAFKRLGINSNIIARIDDNKPDWNQLITSLLNWANNREEVKNLLSTVNDSKPRSIEEQVANTSNTNIKSFISLNQILFGPPGTGKTYHTVNEALRLTGVAISDLTRAQIKEEFDKKMKEGQIVFTTFHQSMSYEEFMEGIKPIEPEKDGDEVIYRVEPGLFKKLSIEASFEIAKFRKSKETAEALDFSNLYDIFIEEVQEMLINEKEVVLKTKSGGTVLIDSISQQGNIIIKHVNGTRTYTVSKTRLTKLQAAIDSLDSVSNINDEFREVIGGSNSSAYWSVLNAIKQISKRVNGKVEEKTYTYNDKEEVVKKMTKEEFITVKGKNYVLIIDEINRGNVSQIFGELITLIEEDKRLGKDEALEVILPYSKDRFGVPPNLYIVGTMNTADRSVEALDTALRRRFSFTEMPPKPELLEPSLMLQRLWMKYDDVPWEDPQWVEKEVDLFDIFGCTILDRKIYEALEAKNNLNIPPGEFKTAIKFEGLNLEVLLNVINARIEKLLDRDHLIGHSYFMRVNSWGDLQETFYRNIIPLLQEYFFGDYAKIGAVLGSGIVYTEKEFDQVDFATGYENEDFADKNIYQIIDYRPNQPGNKYIKPFMNFEKAIRLMMNQMLEHEIES